MSNAVITFFKPSIAVAVFFCFAVGAFEIIVGEHGEIEKTSSDGLSPEGVVSSVTPHRELSPTNVVRIQLDGLSDLDGPAGVARCFRFASPANKAVTGPLERFAQLVRKHPYSILSEATDVLMGQPQLQSDGRTHVVVTVISNHEAHSFAWVLSRQIDGEFRDCWMTDSVVSIENSENRSQRDAI